MNSMPLGYESLKAVITYMDPNLRFQISRRLPSIHSLEKRLPLIIDTLEFTEPLQYQINNTRYKLTTLRIYPTSDIPKIHKEENENGGVLYDLDQFGFRDDSANDIITPGDVVIYADRNERRNDNEEDRYMNILRNDERVLASRNGVEPAGDELTNFYLKWRIDYYKSVLLSYQYRRANVPAPFQKWYQLKIGESQVLRRPGNIRLYEVEKQILSSFLDGRKAITLVKHLKILGDNVIRLPEHLKIKVHTLDIPQDTLKVCESLKDLICVPLKHLIIPAFSVAAFNHPMIRSAEQLTIFNHFSRGRKFLRLRNKRIHVTSHFIPPEIFGELIQNWIDTRKEIGSQFTFGMANRVNAENVLRVAVEQFNGRQRKAGLVKVAMSASAEIHVSYTRRDQQWILAIKVLETGI